MAASTPSAASAEVSHPAKQGLVQSFSVYIDTLFVCTATGLMLIITGCYSVQGADGGCLFTGMGEAGADATWVQAAVSTLMPTFGSKFVAIALFFFAFTTILNQCYSTACSVSYFFVDKVHEPQWVTKACYAVFCLAAVYGSVIAANRAWDLGDAGLGLIVWINYLFLLLSCPWPYPHRHLFQHLLPCACAVAEGVQGSLSQYQHRDPRGGTMPASPPC